MITRRVGFGDMAFVLLMVATIPVAAYLASLGLYIHALIATGAAVVGLAMTFTSGPRRVPATIPVALLDMVVAPLVPAVLRVTSATGNCPLGYQPGQTWTIRPAGQITPSLCRPAVVALNPFLPGVSDRVPQQAACACPVRGNRVVFVAQSA